MTNRLIHQPATQVLVPPIEATHRGGQRGTTAIAVLVSVLGALLVAGGLFWTGLTDTSDTLTSIESTVASDSSATTEAAVAALTDVSDIAAQAVDSVVVVNVTIDTRGPFDTSGSGSGVIISEDGSIVTNAHVVDDATSISVELANGSTYVATVLALNTDKDIAILDIDATGLTPIELGSASDLAVGDPVIAIGNPLALEGGPSVSTGIVSALDRVLEDSDARLTGIIQTDAAITEGSSGGALLDAKGRLIGITTAVGVSSVGVEGIAFAVPVETLIEVLAALSGV